MYIPYSGKYLPGKIFAKASTNVLRKIFKDSFLYSPGLGEINFQSNLDFMHSQHAECDRSVVSSASYERENFVMEDFERECVLRRYHVDFELYSSRHRMLATATFASSITDKGSNNDSGLAGSERSPLRP